MKEERLQPIPQKYKGLQEITSKTICQEIWKPRWNGQISRKYNLTKLNEEEVESPNRQIAAGEIKAVIKKTPNTQQPWTRWIHRRILQSI